MVEFRLVRDAMLWLSENMLWLTPPLEEVPPSVDEEMLRSGGAMTR